MQRDLEPATPPSPTTASPPPLPPATPAPSARTPATPAPSLRPATTPSPSARTPATPSPSARRLLAWLALGAIATLAAHMRWSVGWLGFVAATPFLHVLTTTRGWRPRAALAATLLVTWVAASAKIVTAPLPLLMALPVGVAIALPQLAGMLLWDRLRPRLGVAASSLAFASCMIVAEWLQVRTTPLATWGAAAYTQVDDLPLLQLAAFGGLFGVSFLVHAIVALAESAWQAAEGRLVWRQVARPLAGGAVALLLVHGLGAARLARPLPAGLARVAAIDTIATFGADPELPGADERGRIVDQLIADTRAAAAAGARLVVWTEAAALVMPDEEDALVERFAALARELDIHLVVAYIVPRQLAPLRYDNLYRWLTPAGAVHHRWRKHHPAPGEPSIVGTEAPVTVDTALGRATGAICYDYDYPELARQHGRLGVDLVALPSSDWRGIDPLHTQMAALRAIEQGFSIVRATRFGLSAAIDGHGRLRAWRSSFDGGDRVLLAELPRRGTPTVYRRVGDVPVHASFVWLLVLGIRAARRK